MLQTVKMERLKHPYKAFTHTEKLLILEDFNQQFNAIKQQLELEYLAAKKLYVATLDQRMKTHNTLLSKFKTKLAESITTYESHKSDIINKIGQDAVNILIRLGTYQELFTVDRNTTTDMLLKGGFIRPVMLYPKRLNKLYREVYLLTEKGRNYYESVCGFNYMRANRDRPLEPLPPTPPSYEDIRVTVYHPTYNTKYTINRRGLDQIQSYTKLK